MDTAWLYYRGAIETINRSLKMKETHGISEQEILGKMDKEAILKKEARDRARRYQTGNMCLSTWFPTEVLKDYKQAAKEKEINLPWLVRRLLRDYFEGKIDLKL